MIIRHVFGRSIQHCWNNRKDQNNFKNKKKSPYKIHSAYFCKTKLTLLQTLSHTYTATLIGHSPLYTPTHTYTHTHIHPEMNISWGAPFSWRNFSKLWALCSNFVFGIKRYPNKQKFANLYSFHERIPFDTWECFVHFDMKRNWRASSQWKIPFEIHPPTKNWSVDCLQHFNRNKFS